MNIYSYNQELQLASCCTLGIIQETGCDNGMLITVYKCLFGIVKAVADDFEFGQVKQYLSLNNATFGALVRDRPWPFAARATLDWTSSKQQ